MDSSSLAFQGADISIISIPWVARTPEAFPSQILGVLRFLGAECQHDGIYMVSVVLVLLV